MWKYNLSSRKTFSAMVMLLITFLVYLVIYMPVLTVTDWTDSLPLFVMPPKYKTVIKSIYVHTEEGTKNTHHYETIEPTVGGIRRAVCVRKTNVAFLKVHKAGSTTMMNIFLRFGVGNNLNIVLPNRGYGGGFNYLGYGKTVDVKNIVPIPSNETYNILCNHVVYNKTAFAKIMPNNSVYIGIIREPVSQFMSASMYYGFVGRIAKFRNITGMQARDIYHEYFTNISQYKHISTVYVRNRMSFDFGLPVDRFTDDLYIDKFISGLDKDFKLVMILERFLESLILMKRFLCWDLSDILYVPLNINKNKMKKKVEMFPFDEKSFSAWARADMKLYKFFNAKFERQVRAEGPDFQNEVEYFRKLQNTVVQYCLSSNPRTLVVKKSKYNSEILVARTMCKIMKTSELTLTKTLIERAKSKYTKWLSSKPYTEIKVSGLLEAKGKI